MFVKGRTDPYEVYNMGLPKPLPPPRNPQRAKAFLYACADLLIELENEELDKASKPKHRYPGFVPPK